jgi:hypothetical protein
VFILRFLLTTDEVFKLTHSAMHSCARVHRSWQCEDFETMCCVDVYIQQLNLILEGKVSSEICCATYNWDFFGKRKQNLLMMTASSGGSPLLILKRCSRSLKHQLIWITGPVCQPKNLMKWDSLNYFTFVSIFRCGSYVNAACLWTEMDCCMLSSG